MKITLFNEFINNDIVKFRTLYENLFMETARLSSIDMIKENKNYKDIISIGDRIVPLLMSEIIENDGDIIMYFIVEDICNIPISDEHRGIKSILKEVYKKWWVINGIYSSRRREM